MTRDPIVIDINLDRLSLVYRQRLRYQATFSSLSTQSQSGPADAVYTYWSQLQLNHYAQAFDLFTPAEPTVNVVEL